MITNEEQERITFLSDQFLRVLNPYNIYFRNNITYVHGMKLKNTTLNNMLGAYFEELYISLSPKIQRLIREQIFRVLRGENNNG